jgi:hypothetical protein
MAQRGATRDGIRRGAKRDDVVVHGLPPGRSSASQSWVNGVSTRAVDGLVAALGIGSGIWQVGGVADLRRTR